ncbi:hypothetical protein SBOR_3624 [Sclerotinia borealis F-4128]|uniref:Uncharacterized protein n=1 Tax=Sclerotinia borealis (strain F-4128) TaxID=1432307 RepID=W9CMX4_SCLBF|nr:hypothetical protein SBOR_3624 [Sclerotinia borealis F-4128]
MHCFICNGGNPTDSGICQDCDGFLPRGAIVQRVDIRNDPKKSEIVDANVQEAKLWFCEEPNAGKEPKAGRYGNHLVIQVEVFDVKVYVVIAEDPEKSKNAEKPKNPEDAEKLKKEWDEKRQLRVLEDPKTEKDVEGRVRISVAKRNENGEGPRYKPPYTAQLLLKEEQTWTKYDRCIEEERKKKKDEEKKSLGN